jgi:hypothetical protein
MTNDLMPADACLVAQRLACATCPTSVVVLAVRDAGVGLTCCGTPMQQGTPITCSAVAPSAPRGSRMRAGHEYADPSSGLTLRCIREGSGRVAADGRPLVPRLRAARVLPRPERWR